MERHKIKREIVAVFMESPFYFTIPVKRRLEFIKFFSQKPVYHHVWNLNQPQMAKRGRRTADSR
jgi:hypothetical protein